MIRGIKKARKIFLLFVILYSKIKIAVRAKRVTDILRIIYKINYEYINQIKEKTGKRSVPESLQKGILRNVPKSLQKGEKNVFKKIRITRI